MLFGQSQALPAALPAPLLCRREDKSGWAWESRSDKHPDLSGALVAKVVKETILVSREFSLRCFTRKEYKQPFYISAFFSAELCSVEHAQWIQCGRGRRVAVILLWFLILAPSLAFTLLSLSFLACRKELILAVMVMWYTVYYFDLLTPPHVGLFPGTANLLLWSECS